MTSSSGPRTVAGISSRPALKLPSAKRGKPQDLEGLPRVDSPHLVHGGEDRLHPLPGGRPRFMPGEKHHGVAVRAVEPLVLDLEGVVGADKWEGNDVHRRPGFRPGWREGISCESSFSISASSPCGDTARRGGVSTPLRRALRRKPLLPETLTWREAIVVQGGSFFRRPPFSLREAWNENSGCVYSEGTYALGYA